MKHVSIHTNPLRVCKIKEINMKGYAKNIVAVRSEAISHGDGIGWSTINTGEWVCVLCDKVCVDMECAKEHLAKAHQIVKVTQGCFDGCALLKK